MRIFKPADILLPIGDMVSTFCPFIGFEVEHTHYSAAYCAVFECALKIDVAVGICFENTGVEISLHCGVNFYALRLRILRPSTRLRTGSRRA